MYDLSEIDTGYIKTWYVVASFTASTSKKDPLEYNARREKEGPNITWLDRAHQFRGRELALCVTPLLTETLLIWYLTV